MDLELATINQIIYELVKRDKTFILLMPPTDIRDELRPEDATVMHCCGHTPDSIFQELAAASVIMHRVVEGEELPDSVKIIPIDVDKFLDCESDPLDDPWNLEDDQWP